MKKLMWSLVAAGALFAAGAAQAQDGQALAKSEGCLTCHAVGSKKMGPALKTAAAEWKKNKLDADKGAAALKAKHADLKTKDADLKAIAGWILTL